MNKKYSEEINFFRKKIRIKRLEMEMSQEEMAEIVGCHVNTISKLERGKYPSSFVTIIKIARALNVSPKDLMPD